MPFAFFDLDDTLVDAKAALRAWSVDFAAEYVSGAGVEDAASDVYECVAAAANWTDFVAQARSRYGMTVSDSALMEHVAAVFPGKFVLEQQVRSALAELRGDGWRIGVVTNG